MKEFKRYVATVDFYVYASSDEEAIEQAKKFCEKASKENDNDCELLEIAEQPKGTLENRFVYEK